MASALSYGQVQEGKLNPEVRKRFEALALHPPGILVGIVKTRNAKPAVAALKLAGVVGTAADTFPGESELFVAEPDRRRAIAILRRDSHLHRYAVTLQIPTVLVGTVRFEYVEPAIHALKHAGIAVGAGGSRGYGIYVPEPDAQHALTILRSDSKLHGYPIELSPHPTLDGAYISEEGIRAARRAAR
jgi:hypothetical protein